MTREHVKWSEKRTFQVSFIWEFLTRGPKPIGVALTRAMIMLKKYIESEFFCIETDGGIWNVETGFI